MLQRYCFFVSLCEFTCYRANDLKGISTIAGLIELFPVGAVVGGFDQDPGAACFGVD